MKLGEFFVQKGVITARQLEECLRAQLIFGGHLGTCLIELGFVDEHTLGKTLAEMFQVDYALPHLLDDIPKSLIELLPRRIAEKHHAVPFERKDKLLHVAMIDPKNLPALDEIAFATGHKIRPWVSPEARIFQVLERYYDLPRRQRYITVCQDLDQAGTGRRPRPIDPAPRGGEGGVYAPPPYLAELPQSPVAAAIDDIPSAGRAKGQTLGDPQAALTDALIRAERAGDLAGAALDHAARSLTRSALFLVKGTDASLWRSRGLGAETPRTPPAPLSVTGDPPFALLLGRGHYLGPMPGVGRSLDFYALLRVEPPAQVLLIPGYLEDRLVVVLYGDAGPAPIRADVADLDLMVRKLACSLQLVLIKKKIRSLEAAVPPAGEGDTQAA